MAGPAPLPLLPRLRVSTRSHLKAASKINRQYGRDRLFQHTAAWRRLTFFKAVGKCPLWFQHTAARRRLARAAAAHDRDFRFNTQPPEGGCPCFFWCAFLVTCFNTQPPKGGWTRPVLTIFRPLSFNTQPPKGGWAKILIPFEENTGFNTQPPKGGWFISGAAETADAKFQHTAA